MSAWLIGQGEKTPELSIDQVATLFTSQNHLAHCFVQEVDPEDLLNLSMFMQPEEYFAFCACAKNKGSERNVQDPVFVCIPSAADAAAHGHPSAQSQLSELSR